MFSINRRTLLQTGTCFGTASLLSIYPQPAEAWIWLIGRALLSFSGRSVGGRVVRTLARNGAKASRPVRTRTSAYTSKVRPYYPIRERKSESSYPFAEFVGKELGQYGAESAFDYVYNLNNAHYGGIDQALVTNGNENDGGVGFSTGNGNRGVADFHASHVRALDTCSERLEKEGFTAAEITGLLYPVISQRNNFSSSGYLRVGLVSYRTAFGYVRMESYHTGQKEVRADVIAQDEITNRFFRWYQVIA